MGHPMSRVNEIIEHCDVTRSSLYNYRKREDFPGFDAELDLLKRWIDANRGSAGRPREGEKPKPRSDVGKGKGNGKRKERKEVATKRKPRKASKPKEPQAAEPPPTQDAEQEIEATTPNDGPAVSEAYLLNLQYKQSQIEKNQAAANKHLQQAMANYCDRVKTRVNEGLDIVFRELVRLDLDADQLRRVKEAAADAARHVENRLKELDG